MDEFNNIHFVLCLDFRSIILRFCKTQKASFPINKGRMCVVEQNSLVFYSSQSNEGQSVNEATQMRVMWPQLWDFFGYLIELLQLNLFQKDFYKLTPYSVFCIIWNKNLVFTPLPGSCQALPTWPLGMCGHCGCQKRLPQWRLSLSLSARKLESRKE